MAYGLYDVTRWGREVNENCPNELEIFDNLKTIVIKHPSGIKEIFGKKTHYKILNGETKELILSGSQLNRWNCRKPITIYTTEDDEVLRVEFKTDGIFKDFLPPKRAVISVLPGRTIGFITTKAKLIAVDFKIYDETGQLHFTVKSQEKIFKHSEYPILTTDGLEVGRIIRSGTKLTLRTAEGLNPIIRAIFTGLALLLNCVVREGAGT